MSGTLNTPATQKLLLHTTTASAVNRIVLGSRSPRRRDLLSAAIGAERLVCLPPASATEAGFHKLQYDTQIKDRLLQIARAKHEDVAAQLPYQPWFDRNCPPVLVVADTTVVAGPRDGSREVLEQPGPALLGTDVRDWFLRLLSGKTHTVLTAVLVSRGTHMQSQIVATEVEFATLSEQQIDWYLATGEPQGKAGGYAVQGLAATFVKRVSGSLTGVIGLPLLETMQLIHNVSLPQ